MITHRLRCPDDGELLYKIHAHNSKTVPGVWFYDKCRNFYRLTKVPIILTQPPTMNARGRLGRYPG